MSQKKVWNEREEEPVNVFMKSRTESCEEMTPEIGVVKKVL